MGRERLTTAAPAELEITKRLREERQQMHHALCVVISICVEVAETDETAIILLKKALEGIYPMTEELLLQAVTVGRLFRLKAEGVI